MREPEFAPYGPCWCKSGIKFKFCHFKRHLMKPMHCREFVSRFNEIQKEQLACICTSDATNCVSSFGKNHSISKRSMLSCIAEKNHVYRITNEPIVGSDDNSIVNKARFERVSHNVASTFRAICSHHDTKLFKALDNFDISDISRFIAQGFYRSVALEIARKQSAINAIPLQRELDKGASVQHQKSWQSTTSNDQIAHRLGLQMLDKLRIRLEPSVLGAKVQDFSYVVSDVSISYPLAAFSAFQPSRTLDYRKLQSVNEFLIQDGRLISQMPETVFAFCLPTKNRTLVGICAFAGDDKAVKFIQSLKQAEGDLVDNIIGVLLLHVENIFFRPSYIDMMDVKMRLAIEDLFLVAIGEDAEIEHVKMAKSLTLFKNENTKSSIYER